MKRSAAPLPVGKSSSRAGKCKRRRSFPGGSWLNVPFRTVGASARGAEPERIASRDEEPERGQTATAPSARRGDDRAHADGEKIGKGRCPAASATPGSNLRRKGLTPELGSTAAPTVEAAIEEAANISQGRPSSRLRSENHLRGPARIGGAGGVLGWVDSTPHLNGPTEIAPVGWQITCTLGEVRTGRLMIYWGGNSRVITPPFTKYTCGKGKLSRGPQGAADGLNRYTRSRASRRPTSS